MHTNQLGDGESVQGIPSRSVSPFPQLGTSNDPIMPRFNSGVPDGHINAPMMQSSSANTRMAQTNDYRSPFSVQSEFSMAYDDSNSVGGGSSQSALFDQTPAPYKFTASPPPRANSTPPTSHMATQRNQQKFESTQDYSQLVLGVSSLGLGDQDPKMNRIALQQHHQQQRYLQWMSRQGGSKPPPQSLDAVLNDSAPWNSNGNPGVITPGGLNAPFEMESRGSTISPPGFGDLPDLGFDERTNDDLSVLMNNRVRRQKQQQQQQHQQQHQQRCLDNRSRQQLNKFPSTSSLSGLASMPMGPDSIATDQQWCDNYAIMGGSGRNNINGMPGYDIPLDSADSHGADFVPAQPNAPATAVT
ncbi:hypothetical protein BX666DRAFT_367723 [Dichotomocladium elegans]|nr:hypothetical protein BX666DRAFT_367723 [Dichotomocladium elegans]